MEARSALRLKRVGLRLKRGTKCGDLGRVGASGHSERLPKTGPATTENAEESELCR